MKKRLFLCTLYIKPFGSVITIEQFIIIMDTLTKNLVFPLPEPPMTQIFLFLAYFGFLGRLSMVMDYVAVRGMFIQKSSAI